MRLHYYDFILHCARPVSTAARSEVHSTPAVQRAVPVRCEQPAIAMLVGLRCGLAGSKAARVPPRENLPDIDEGGLHVVGLVLRRERNGRVRGVACIPCERCCLCSAH